MNDVIKLVEIGILVAALTVGSCMVHRLNVMVDQIDSIAHQVETLVQQQQHLTDLIESESSSPQKPECQHLITESERGLVEAVIAAEARGEEGLAAKMAVAQTIRDRMLWGLTAREVVTAPKQFATPYYGYIEPHVQAEIKEAVVRVFDTGERVFEEPTTHFHALEVTPGWTRDKVFRGQIGRHRFYGQGS